MSKTVRDVVATEWPDVPDMESTGEFDMGIHEGMHRCGGALHRCGILDYPVIEPSGVVLKVDREKLVGAACAEEVRSDAVEGYTRPLSKDEATAIVDAILTSLAGDGFREVDVLLRTADAPMTISHGPGADIAVLKPLPPAKGD